MANDPDIDRDAIIKRLIAEQSQTGQLIEQVKCAINSDPEFQGLSMVGGIKTIIRRYKEVQDKNMKLEKELTLMMQSKKR